MIAPICGSPKVKEYRLQSGGVDVDRPSPGMMNLVKERLLLMIGHL